jgi:hypothetical protein
LPVNARGKTKPYLTFTDHYINFDELPDWQMAVGREIFYPIKEDRMNIKKWLIASVVVFIVYSATMFLIHNVLLMNAYQDTANIWRAMEDMQSKMWLMYIGNLIFSFLFVLIFSLGYEGKGVVEGFRYGVLFGAIYVIPGSLGNYAVSPISFQLALSWIIYGLLQITLCGIVAALIYRK